jgi:uncharacterized DUF497 family protein
MRFHFDPAKAAVNWRKHGVSLAEAEAVFHDPLALHRADPDVEGESRMVAIGEGSVGVLLVVVYAECGNEVRLISARRATRRETKSYAE